MFFSPYKVAVVLLVACISAEDSPSADTEAAECDPNWVFSGGFCYFFSEPEDLVNPTDAAHQCLLSNAEHFYPESAGELEFIQSQAEARPTYGWSINLQKLSYGEEYSLVQSHVFSGKKETFTPEFLPEVQKVFDKDFKCVALHVGDKAANPWSSHSSEISTEPCDVKLWVACEAREDDFPDQAIDYERWFSHGDLVFWLSGKLASQADAKSVCQKEGMELLSSVTDLMSALNVTFDLVPWWTSLSLGPHGPRYEDGKLVDFSLVSWRPQKQRYATHNVVLLHSGKIRYEEQDYKDTSGLPYVCRKRAADRGLFGCPYGWVRGGRSCYYLSKTTEVTWFKARESCEARSSHLVSIDSRDEKLWMETVVFRHLKLMWTSANDLDSEGNFTWHDGSRIDTSLLPWLTAASNEYTMIYDSNCGMFYPEKGEFIRTYCTSRAPAACQYDLGAGETRCETNWHELDGTCYLLGESRMTLRNVKRYCRNLIKHTRVAPLTVKSKKVLEFLSTIIPGNSYYYLVWLGMEQGETLESWRWFDSSLVDFSVFDNVHDQPDNGNGGEPENCVAVNTMFRAFDLPCKKGLAYICEKQLPSRDALAPAPGGGTSFRVRIFVPVFSLLTGLLASRWL